MDPLTTLIALPIITNYIAALMGDLTSSTVIASTKALKTSQSHRFKAIDIQAEFDNLNRELKSIHSFLRDAESSPQTSASQANWVEQVKNAARDIQDMVDQIVYCARGQVWDKSWSSKALDYMNDHLPKIKHEFESGIPQRRARYMPQNPPAWQEQSSHGSYPLWHQHPAVDEVIGMEQDVDTVIGWLKSDHSRNTVVSICGMGGLGKTTLARRAYTNEQVKRHFESSAWVSAALLNGPEQLLRTILIQMLKPEQATQDNLEQSSRVVLLGLLQQCLQQQRCLIVLDDVSNRNAYNDFSYILQNAKAGSRIIVTTRDHHIASTLSLRTHILTVKPLPESDAWALFCRKAFWNEPNASCPTDLEEWARRTVAKCECLPLGIVALGSFMGSKDWRALTWKHLHNSIRSELGSDETLLKMSRILMRSFDELPYHLKMCYLYCCRFFPENHVIKKGWLFRLWEAEGFVEQTHERTMEEVAEGYLDVLILRNMLQVAKKDESGRIVSCRVHGLMREISFSAADGDEFCSALDEKRTTIDEKARRLSVQVSISERSVSPPKLKQKKAKAPVAVNSLSRLRSLVFFAPFEASAAAFLSMSPDLMLLRVLELKGVPIDHVPDEVVDLFSLRYLSLRDTRVEHLPERINRLQMLETLDVRGSMVSCIPCRLAKIRGFRHLLIDQARIGEWDDILLIFSTGHSWVSKLKGLRTLKSIEANDVWLISALAFLTRHSWVSKLKGLRTLKSIEANDVWLISALASLTQLRRLGLKNVQVRNGDKLCHSIAQLGQLLSLTVSAAAGEVLKLDSLASPPPYLRKLVLEGRMCRAPQWFSLLGSLTHLYLTGSQQEESCSPLPLLEKLGNLVHLTLHRAYYGEQLRFGAKQFSSLRSLNIVEFKCLSKLIFEEGALPRLCVLHLCSCQNLQAWGLLGIDNLLALQHLYFKEMPANLTLIFNGDHRLKKSSGWKSISKSMSWL